MFNWIKNNPWKSAGIAIVLIYAIMAIVKKEANPMNWFAAAGANLRKKCTNDGRGNCSYNGQSVACSACADRGLL